MIRKWLDYLLGERYFARALGPASWLVWGSREDRWWLKRTGGERDRGAASFGRLEMIEGKVNIQEDLDLRVQPVWLGRKIQIEGGDQMWAQVDPITLLRRVAFVTCYCLFLALGIVILGFLLGTPTEQLATIGFLLLPVTALYGLRRGSRALILCQTPVLLVVIVTSLYFIFAIEGPGLFISKFWSLGSIVVHSLAIWEVLRARAALDSELVGFVEPST